jgi:C4-type Zn-finger protein
MTNTYELVFEASAEVERHPDCPVCGHTDCETNHTADEETPQ